MVAAGLRIAFLSYRGHPYVGGQGVYTRQLTAALSDLGHHVEVLGGQPYPELDSRVALTRLPSLDIFNDHFPGRSPAYWEIRGLADVVEVGQFSLGTFSEPLAFSIRAAQHLRARPGTFDVVHDNQSLGYGLLAIARSIPTLATLHHPISRDLAVELAHARSAKERRGKRRWYGFVTMQARVARRLPRSIVVSETSIEDFHTDFGIERDRMRLVYVGVDTDRFRPLPQVERRPGHLVTTASSDVPMKGLTVLLEAVAKLRTERHVELTVIGRPKPNSRALHSIERLGLGAAVRWVSGLTDAEVVETYASAELAVVPSLYEGFSLPAAEAMSTGTALVATTGGALAEVTGRDGDTVLSCPPGDPEALAAAIVRGLADPVLRARLGAAGRQRVVERWTWRHTAEATADQYRATIDMHSATRSRRC